MSYKIRLAETEDLPCILEIYQAAREFMRQTGNPNQWWDYHPAESVLREDIPKKQLYICEQDGQIGAVFAYIQGEDPTYLQINGPGWLNNEPYGTIHRIASCGRGGVFGSCIDYCLGITGHLRIDTHNDNKVMQHVVEKHGFHRRGIIYIADGSPRIAYERI